MRTFDSTQKLRENEHHRTHTDATAVAAGGAAHPLRRQIGSVPVNRLIEHRDAAAARDRIVVARLFSHPSGNGKQTIDLTRAHAPTCIYRYPRLARAWRVFCIVLCILVVLATHACAPSGVHPNRSQFSGFSPHNKQIDQTPVHQIPICSGFG